MNRQGWRETREGVTAIIWERNHVALEKENRSRNGETRSDKIC